MRFRRSAGFAPELVVRTNFEDRALPAIGVDVEGARTSRSTTFCAKLAGFGIRPKTSQPHAGQVGFCTKPPSVTLARPAGVAQARPVATGDRSDIVLRGSGAASKTRQNLIGSVSLDGEEQHARETDNLVSLRTMWACGVGTLADHLPNKRARTLGPGLLETHASHRAGRRRTR